MSWAIAPVGAVSTALINRATTIATTIAVKEAPTTTPITAS
jgi:hypothetical protein